MVLDRMFYLVISERRDGPIIYEIEPSRMDMSSVAKDIRDKQYGQVMHVIEFNPIEHICKDVTNDFTIFMG
jgi:hypothetical protein